MLLEVMPCVVAAMKEYPQNWKIQRYGCELLWKSSAADRMLKSPMAYFLLTFPFTYSSGKQESNNEGRRRGCYNMRDDNAPVKSGNGDMGSWGIG